MSLLAGSHCVSRKNRVVPATFVEIGDARFRVTDKPTPSGVYAWALR